MRQTRRTAALAAAAFALTLAAAAPAFAQAASNPPANEQGATVTPPGNEESGMGPGMTDQYGMGPGMMYRYRMGPEMMYRYGMGPGMMYRYQGGQMAQPGGANEPGLSQYGYVHPPLNLSVADVKGFFSDWVARTGNSHLKLGKVAEKDKSTITVDIVTKDGSLVQRFDVNRATGYYHPAG